MRLFSKNMLWAVGMLVTIVLIAGVLMSVSTHALGGQARVILFLLTHQWTFFSFRIALIGLFFILWPMFINYLAKQYTLSNDSKATLIQRRMRYALWLVIINVALVWL